MKCLKCLLPFDDSTQEHYGLHSDCFSEWFKVPSNECFLSLTRQSSSTSDQTGKLSSQNTSFFHGKFKKYSAQLLEYSYILKMRELEAPELPEVEYLCNQIGKALGIPVAEFYIINFEGDLTFVTKNFIKHFGPIDLQHIYHFRKDSEHSCENLLQVIIEQTKRPYDVKVLIETILFDALIGNNDRHGRNLALVIRHSESMLSPIYDNVSYLSLEKGSMLKADFNPAGKISTQETYEPSMKDYIEELKRLNYHDHVYEFYRKIKFAQLELLIQESFCSVLMKEAMTRLIKKRYKELEDGFKD